MKVLLLNGSPNEKGCTFTALSEVSLELHKEGIETDIVQIGDSTVTGCTACRKCSELKQCVFEDKVNEVLKIVKNYDGFIIGSPVHFASATGTLTTFLDRLFYADLCSGRQSFYLKPAAAVVSARRAGTTATLDQLNKYFQIMEMPIISSQYWNMVHGQNPEDVHKDEEGMQIMRTLGKNMAFMMKCREIGLKSGVKLPVKEERKRTNFIR